MKISKIIVENYRSIKRVEVEPNRFSIFIGQNNHGKTNFFEAVACTSGVVDPVPPKPDLVAGEFYLSHHSIEDSNRPRVLRILSAIGTKYEKFKGYVVDSRSGVSENDCLIIAISGANIEFASRSDVLLKRAVFGVGLDAYRKDLTDKLVGPFYAPAPNIVKKARSGNKTIPTSFMEMEDFSNVSAIVYCGHHAYNCNLNGHQIGDDFLFAYHVNAKNSIPDGLFKFGRGIRKFADGTIIDKKQV